MADPTPGDSSNGSVALSGDTTTTRFSRMKVSELRDELRKKGLSPNGMRGQLIDRLVQAESGISVDSQPSKQAETIVNTPPQPVPSNPSPVARDDTTTNTRPDSGSEVDVPSYDDDDDDDDDNGVVNNKKENNEGGESKVEPLSAKVDATTTIPDMEKRALCFVTLKQKVPLARSRFLEGLATRVPSENLEYVFFDVSQANGLVVVKNISDIPLVTQVLENNPACCVNTTRLVPTFKVIPIPVSKVWDMVVELSNILLPKVLRITENTPHIVERRILPQQQQQQQQRQPYRQSDKPLDNKRMPQREPGSIPRERSPKPQREPELEPQPIRPPSPPEDDVWSRFQQQQESADPGNEMPTRASNNNNNNGHSYNNDNNNNDNRNSSPRTRYGHSPNNDSMYNDNRRKHSWSDYSNNNNHHRMPPEKRMRTDYTTTGNDPIRQHGPLPPQERIAPATTHTLTDVTTATFDDSHAPQSTKTQPPIQFRPVSDTCKRRRLENKSFIYRPILSHDDYLQRHHGGGNRPWQQHD